MSPPRDDDWSRLGELVAERLGLHFPAERRAELERGVAAAARELGYGDTASCIESLLSSPPDKAQVRVLASHLTIGETYFFRDRPVMEALADCVLPELIRARRGGERRLRIWSAACCTGEEAYTAAILLHRLLPDLREWRVTITATDVNPRFLAKAAAGRYREWSFRAAPPWLKQRYFERAGDGSYAVRPEIAAMVTFAPLNLATDPYPSPANGNSAMDLILCRNVLMYLTPERMRHVIGGLHRALAEDGWLAAGPSESSADLFQEFRGVNFPGAILFRKGEPVAQAARALPLAFTPPPPPDPPGDADLASTEEEPAAPLRVRELANQGRHSEALAWCERWIAADKLDSSAHYLRAVVLLEQGEPAQARASLQRAIYLEPGFELAHYALGNLARSAGRAEEARRCYANALRLLDGREPGEPVRESDGLTAGRLAEHLASICAMAPAHD